MSKATKKPDPSEITDTFVVFPKEQLDAAIAALYFTLENSTSEDFNTSVRREMLNALKRLEDD